MTVNRTEALKIINVVYGLQGEDAEKKLQSLSDDELAKLISNNKKDLDKGVSVEKTVDAPSVVILGDNTTYTDELGNEITDFYDGDTILQRIVKDADGNETTVTYRDNKPFTQTKNLNGNVEKSRFTYHEGNEPYVTVDTLKADKTTVKTNAYMISENGEVLDDYIKDKTIQKPDGTKIKVQAKHIDLKSPLNNKKTFFKGDVLEEVEETYSGKKKTTYYEGVDFQNKGRRILAQTSNNTVYYNSDNKPVYNHREYVKKQQEKAYQAEYDKRLERQIPLKGTHTNVLSPNNVTLGKAKNVTVKEFITNILGIDINSETGKKLADRFARLSDDALKMISYNDFEAQTLGVGQYAPKTNDYSKESFEKIARDLRQKSGVNIETEDEITQHKIQMQIQERGLENRRQELRIDANNFAKESLAAVYEQAAGMLLQDRNRKMNPLDPKDYAHFAKILGTTLADNASMGLLAKDAFHQASDYEDFAQKIRNLPADSPEEFAREYEKLTGQKYDAEKVKNLMEFIDKSGLDKMDNSQRAEFLKSDKYKSEFANTFGFRTTENTEKQLSNENTFEEFAGIVGDVYLLVQTGGLSSMKTLVSGSGKLTGRLLSKTALNTKSAGVISETVARSVGGTVSMAGLTAMKSVSGNIVYDEIDATDFDTWKNTAISIGESGVLGAVGGVVGKMAEPVVKYIEKPAMREAQAMLKALSNKGEMSAKELMQTVSQESGISLDGLFKMNKQELVNLIRTTAGKTVEVSAEAAAYGATEAAMDSSDKSFAERLEEQYEMLTKMKGASKLVQMITAGKAGKAALINSSKVLNETKVKQIKTSDGKSQFELTLPNGRTIITENPEHALATCNYLMQAELVEQSVKEEQNVEWRKITIYGEEVEVAVTKGADGVENVDFSKARKRNVDGNYLKFMLTPQKDLLSSESRNNIINTNFEKSDELNINTDNAVKNIEKFAKNLDDKDKTEIFDAANILFSNPNMRNGVVDTIISSCIEENNGIQTFNRQAFDEINKLFETHRKTHPYMSDFTYSLRIAEIAKSGVRKEYDAKGNYKKTFDATNFKIAQLFDECDSNIVHVDFSYTTDNETGLIDVSALPKKFRNYILNNLPNEMKDNVNKIPQEIFDKSAMSEIIKSFGFEEKNGYLVSNENLTDKINDITNIAGGSSKIVLDKEDLDTLHKMINLGNHKDFWRKLDEPEMIVMFLRFKNLFTFHKPPIIEIKGQKFWDRIIYDIQNNKPTEAERDALGDFVGDGYGYINTALSNAKNNKSYNSYYMNEAENLANLIDKHTIDEDINLTRTERNPDRFSDIKLQDGTSLSEILMNFDKYRDNLDEINKELQGKVIENERFMSATVRQGNDLPMQGLDWEMTLKKGSKAIFRNTYTNVNTGELEYIVQKNSNIIIKGIELDWRGVPKLKADVTTERISEYDVLSSEADNVSSFDEINAMRKKISQANLEDKKQHKALFAKLKDKELDIRENNALTKLGAKSGDEVDKHHLLKEYTRNSNSISAIISEKTNNSVTYYNIKLETDDFGNVVSKIKTKLSDYKPKTENKSPQNHFDYSYGYSDDRVAYDGGMSESAFDAFRMRMYPDLFGTYEVKGGVVKGGTNPTFEKLKHLDTNNSRKPINLAPLGNSSIRGRNLLTLSYEIFDEAKAKGIERLIDLRAEAGDKERIKEVNGKKYVRGIEYIHIPMDYSVGRCDPELIQNLGDFFDAMDKGKVYIGCNLGSHRTDFAIAVNYALNTKTKEASPMLYLNMTDIVKGVRRVYTKIMNMTPEERKANNVSDDLLNILPKNATELDARLKRIAEVTNEAK